MAEWDRLWINARLATMRPGFWAYGAIADGAIAVKDGRIAFAGVATEIGAAPEQHASEVVDAGGRWITPGLDRLPHAPRVRRRPCR